MLDFIKPSTTLLQGWTKEATSGKNYALLGALLILISIPIAIIYFFKIPVWKPLKKSYRGYRARRRTRRSYRRNSMK